MLDDAEKEKIRFEEEYRYEVRNQLQEMLNTKKKPNKFWEFLNSSFGLWLLSAICITWLGNVYTQQQNAKSEELKKLELTRAEELKTREAIEKLDSEIGYRLSQIQVELNSLNSTSESANGSPQVAKTKRAAVIEVLNSVSHPPGKDYFAAYPEYSNYSLIALVAELKRYIKDKEEHDELEDVLADLTGIYVLIEVEKTDLSNPQQVATVINKNFINGKRWFDSGFYFLDCSDQSPLC